MNERGDRGYALRPEGLEQLGLRSASVSEVMRYVLDWNSDLRELVDDKKYLIQVQKLLEKSPQFYLLKATEIPFPPVLTVLKRWLFAPRDTLLLHEQVLFDEALASPESLLFSPYEPSLEAKKKIWAMASANFEVRKQRGEKFSELGYRTRDNPAVYDTKYRLPLFDQDILKTVRNPSDFIKQFTGSKPLTNQEVYELLDQASSDMLEKVVGMKIFVPHKEALFVNKANKPTNPDLLIAEELEKREYNVRVFRTVGIEENIDYRHNSWRSEVVFFGDKNAAKVFQDTTLAPERIVLHLLQRAPSLPSYSQLLNYTRILQWDKGEEEEGDQLFGDAWRNAQFTADERKKIKALVLTREIKRHEDAISYGRLTHYLIEHRQEDLKRARGDLGELEVEPIAQPGLRGIITRVVDRESG